MHERNDQLVRRLEAELLDRNHLQFAIIRGSQQMAIPHLLKAVGQCLRELEGQEIDRPLSTLQMMAKTTVKA